MRRGQAVSLSNPQGNSWPAAMQGHSYQEPFPQAPGAGTEPPKELEVLSSP